MKNGFLIRLKNKDAMVITPFQNPKSAVEWDMHERIRWNVSETPQSGELEKLDKLTFSQIDRGIDRWIQDVKYFPRLFCSAAAFLVIYFALSFAVRDPIPVIDEFIAGLAGSAVVWYLLDRKAVKSDASIKRRLEFKQRVSDAEIVLVHSLAEIEDWMSNLSQKTILALCDSIVRSTEADLASFEIPASEFVPMLEEYCMLNIPKLMKLVPQILEARKDTDPNVQLSGRLVQAGQKSLDDLVLLALVVKAKEMTY